MKKCKVISTLVFLMCLCLSFAMTSAACTTFHQVPYGQVTKITLLKKTISPGKKTSIKVSKKANSKERKYSWSSIRFKSLTPSVASVSSKGIVKGKKCGTAKIKVTAKYSIKERAYRKCLGKTKVIWITRKCQEVKILKLSVSKKLNIVTPVTPDPIPVVGGSVKLYFECDGKAYGNPISVGVGISPNVDYKDSFPANPVKNGFTFAGWYSKNGVKIGTKAMDIYPAFDKIISGNTATVYAKWTPVSQ